uniref:MEI-217 n=1 Tax=Drosophila melanogaster TaxID=7227 RepID=Q9U5X8_DROME|nr:MEI-217 [Drosophila melanogaster]
MSSRRPEDLLAPIQLRLDFEYRQLLDISPQLLQLIVEEPLQFQEAVRYSVYGLIRSHLKDAGLKPIDINQLHAHWRLVGLPFTPGLQFEPRDQLTRLGLSQVRGILAAFTPQETLVLQSIWYCGQCCMRNAIQTSSTDAPFCSSCSRPMSEYQKLRVTETYRILAVLPISAVQTPRVTNCLHRPKLVRLRAHAHDCELKLGASYLITGYFASSASTYQLEACHLRIN